MEEQEISGLMKSAMKKAPSGFSDRVMANVSVEPKVQLAQPRFAPGIVYAFCALLILLSCMISFPEFTIMEYKLSLSTTVIITLSIAFVLYQAYRLQRMREVLKML